MLMTYLIVMNDVMTSSDIIMETEHDQLIILIGQIKDGNQYGMHIISIYMIKKQEKSKTE